MLKYFIRKIVDNIIFWESFFYQNDQILNSLLIIRIDALGDYILFSPSLKEYRKIFPGYFISALVTDKNIDTAQQMGSADEYLSFNRKRFSTNLLYRRKILLQIARANYDVVIYPAFSREPMGDLFVRVSHAKQRIGIVGEWCGGGSAEFLRNNSYYTRLVTLPPWAFSEIQHNTEFMRALGAQFDSELLPVINIPDEILKKSEGILAENNLFSRPFCIVFPGAGSPARVWPAERYAKIVEFLVGQDIVPVICGTPSEKNLAKKIKEFAACDVIDLVGNTDVMTLAAILKRATFYFGSETGILHLACAVGTPTVCLLGGGHFGRFFPYGDLNKNRIVYDEDMKCKNDNWACAKNLTVNEPAPCIGGITVDDAIKEIKDLLKYLNVSKEV